METKRFEDSKNSFTNPINGTANPEQKFMASAVEIKDRVQNASMDLARDSAKWVRRYPVASAVGAAVIGFSAALLFRRSHK